MALYSYPIERHCLGGLIRNQDVFFRIDAFITDADFYCPVHQTIYSVIRSILTRGEKLDKVILAEKVKNLGIKFKDEIEIHSYIVDIISFSSIDKDGTFKAFQELSLLRVKREVDETLDKAKKNLNDPKLEKIDDVISSTDSIVNQRISGYVDIEEPVKLFENIRQKIELRGNNPTKEKGLITPFKDFNRFYGGVRGGGIYAVASRAGQGKTTWLNIFAMGIAQLNNIKALILDTEMSTDEIEDRNAAGLSEVPLYDVENGTFRFNKEKTDKIRAFFDKVEKENRQVYHYHVANKPIDQVISLVRRWYYKHVGRGNQAVIVYDYLKLTGERVDKSWLEHQAMGEKIDKLKRLAEEINSPIITAIQLNRSGEMFNKSSKDVTDDASAIAISDRLSWFASFLAIFRRKTLDEIEVDGAEFGSHKLQILKCRFQGKDAKGHHDIIKRPMPDGSVKYMNNYLNFDVRNFNVEEKGSLHDIAERARLQFKFEKKNKDDGNGELE